MFKDSSSAINQPLSGIQPEKIERRRSMIPESNYSAMMGGHLKRVRRGFRQLISARNLDDDFYQSLSEFIAKFDEAFLKQFGHSFDHTKNQKEEVSFFYRQLDACINQFRHKYDLGDYALDHSSSFEEGNTTSIDGSDNATGNIDFSDKAEVEKDEYWFQEHLNLVKEAILGSKNREPNKNLQWRIFLAFIENGSIRFSEYEPNNNVIEQIQRTLLPEKVDKQKIKSAINGTFELIKSIYGAHGDVAIGDNGPWLQGGKEDLRKEETIPSNLTMQEKVKFVRNFLGIITEEEYKKKKGHVYRLIHRAESNNGKIVYFPGYHDKEDVEISSEDTSQ